MEILGYYRRKVDGPTWLSDLSLGFNLTYTENFKEHKQIHLGLNPREWKLDWSIFHPFDSEGHYC